MILSRRSFFAGLAWTAAIPLPAAAKHDASASSATMLFRHARRAIDQHGARIAHRDRIAIVDFAQPSRMARFHILDLVGGSRFDLLVAHGRGSDPAHSGWLERFSNEPGSKASSSGSYLTGDAYIGRHGKSRRLIGLDRTNSNAEDRAIVIHAAEYVSPAMARNIGKLGRSEGCFAFDGADLAVVLDLLGPGRLIYADKLEKRAGA